MRKVGGKRIERDQLRLSQWGTVNPLNSVLGGHPSGALKRAAVRFLPCQTSFL
uniref:Uncharacterized protein n=1 Tax=Anguilla anguilla TaxID=7936 RepID=A0A0E9R9X8_ANGAN